MFFNQKQTTIYIYFGYENKPLIFDAHAILFQELARLYVHLHRTEFSTSNDCFDP